MRCAARGELDARLRPAIAGRDRASLLRDLQASLSTKEGIEILNFSIEFLDQLRNFQENFSNFKGRTIYGIKVLKILKVLKGKYPAVELLEQAHARENLQIAAAKWNVEPKHVQGPRI